MKKLSKVSGCVVIINDFLNQLSRRNYSKKSIETYTYALKNFAAYIERKNVERLQDITEDDLIKYRKEIVERDLKPNTRELCIRSVKLLFKYMESEGMIFINPAQYLRSPKVERLIKYVPSLKEMDKLLNAPDIDTERGIRDKAILETMYGTGIRLNESVMLNMNDVDLNNGLLKVNGKGSKERIVPLGRHAMEWIERYLFVRKPSDIEALWTSRKGNRLSEIYIQKMIKEYSEKANLKDISAHSIRRACATHMLDNGANPFAIQELLGHADLKTLSQYLRVTITDLKKTHANSEVGQ